MIAVIILNWNNAPDTLECLQTVFASNDSRFSVFVADNGSTDGSLAKLKTAYPQAHFVENRANLGFAEGNNRAILQAIEQGAEYLFLLNNDATIARDTLTVLRKAADEHPNAAALGPKVYFYDSPMTISNGGGEWNPRTAICYNKYRDVDESSLLKNEIEPCSFVCGCALFVRVSTLARVQLMDPRFFLNWEEIDWCFRMRQFGYDCLYVPQAKAWHKVSCSFVGGKRGPMWNYFFYRNRLLWMEKNLPRNEFWRIMRQVIWPELKIFVKESLGKDSTVARAALKGMFDYLVRRFGRGSYHQLLKR